MRNIFRMNASFGFHQPTRILDGNHLAATERRIKELRTIWEAPLPGTTLVVMDPTTGLSTDIVQTPDGHAQERSLLDDVLALVEARDAWIADRNFCTLKFLFRIDTAKAYFIIRQHGNVKGRLTGKRGPGSLPKESAGTKEATAQTHQVSQWRSCLDS